MEHIARAYLVELSTRIPYASHHTMTASHKVNNTFVAGVLSSKSPHLEGDGAHPYEILNSFHALKS